MKGNADRPDTERPAPTANQNGALTPRERDVLELVGAGRGDEEIADVLRIARSTVSLLLRSSMAKLGARTRSQALARMAGNRK
jgi:DNA-binding CsgD family transcriptional regulator